MRLYPNGHYEFNHDGVMHSSGFRIDPPNNVSFNGTWELRKNVIVLFVDTYRGYKSIICELKLDSNGELYTETYANTASWHFQGIAPFDFYLDGYYPLRWENKDWKVIFGILD